MVRPAFCLFSGVPFLRRATHLLTRLEVAMYIIARMILGMGILFCIISGAALIGELGHPKERAVLTS
jgi:hypothetical protein